MNINLGECGWQLFDGPREYFQHIRLTDIPICWDANEKVGVTPRLLATPLRLFLFRLDLQT